MKKLLNLYMSLYPFEYDRRSDLFYRISVLMFLLLALPGLVFGTFFYEGDGTFPRIYSFVIIGIVFTGYLQNFAMGLDAGAFGERLQRYGVSVWKVSLVLVPLIGWPSVLVMSYLMATWFVEAGEPVAAVIFLFGVGILGLVIWGVMDVRKRYLRLRNEGADDE